MSMPIRHLPFDTFGKVPFRRSLVSTNFLIVLRIDSESILLYKKKEGVKKKKSLSLYLSWLCVNEKIIERLNTTKIITG